MSDRLNDKEPARGGRPEPRQARIAGALLKGDWAGGILVNIAMGDMLAAAEPGRNLFGTPGDNEIFAGADVETEEGRAALARIAAKIGRSRCPEGRSDIPAGAAVLLHFVAHDLDCAAPGAQHGRKALELGSVYGGGAGPEASPVLARMQMVWALMHEAIVARLSVTRSDAVAGELARQITQGIYRDVVRKDVLGSWLMPRFRNRYVARLPRRLAAATTETPAEFVAAVGRLGDASVRKIEAWGEPSQLAGLRDLVRCGGAAPGMPPAEDWLVDFSRIFAIGSSVPQRARALGPHVARPGAPGKGVGTDASADGLVLRDLFACARGGLRSVRSLISRAARAEPHLFKGCFAQDETFWIAATAGWLADTGLAPEEIERLAGDPPLALFLMLEAQADSGGKTLGALGSVILGETLTGALPGEETDLELAAARAMVFRARVPASMDEVIRFLQRRCRSARPGGALPSKAPRHAASHLKSGGKTVLDIQNKPARAIPAIEVSDYIEMGRLVALWAADPASRPRNVAALRAQLAGIAVLPERLKTVEFVESTLDHLVVRLPVKEMIEESLDQVTDPMGNGRYPLPQFYADHYRPGFGPVMTPLDTLLARIGDSTIAQCR